MKKLSILFVALLTSGLYLTSCSKDNDEPAASLTGKWNYSKQGSLENGQEVLVNYMDNETGCAKDYSEFSANGTFLDVDYDSTNSPCEMFTSTGTYTRSGNTITGTFGGTTITATILNLTATELKIKNINNQIFIFTRG